MDISRNLGLAHTSVKRNLTKLTKLGLIKKEIQKKGNRKFPVYAANIENKAFKKYKMIYNLTAIIESGLIDFLGDKLAPKSVVVFGSYRRGEDVEDSDIDIFIEGLKGDLNLGKFERRLKRKIQLHFKKDFTSYPEELKNNIINGIVLLGFLEGYK